MKVKECFVLLTTLVLCLFANSSIGLLLLITHILSALTVGIILGLISRINTKKDINSKYVHNQSNSKKVSNNQLCTFSNLGEILSNAIMDSSKTIIMIGGFVVIFSVIISILNNSRILQIISYSIYPILKFLNIDVSFAGAIISGIVELTNGVSLVCNIANKTISLNIIICSFLLGFGGLSVLLQVLSITSKSDLSIKKYIYSKLLQGIIAASYTYIFINMCPILNLNI